MASLDQDVLVASLTCQLAFLGALGQRRGHLRHPQPLALWSCYVTSSACKAMYWKSDQMFVCKLEGKDVPELAVPREKVSKPMPGRIR